MTRDSEAELQRDFMRLIEGADCFVLEVGTVSWDGPEKPRIDWTPVNRWSSRPTAENLDAVARALLSDRRFFQRCRRCRELVNIGHMSDCRTCQGCAESLLGIVH